VIFRPDMAQAILEGRKTVTRRPRTGRTVGNRWQNDPCRYREHRTYALQPGRGQRAIARIRILSVRPEALHELTDDEVRREGFASRGEFEQTWLSIYGRSNYLDPVWRIEFELEEPA
jgi:hypothetical protein